MTKRIEAIKAVRDMGDDELHGHIRTQRSKLFELRFQMATGQVENHRQTREIRREIARAMTIDKEHERGIVRAERPSVPAAVHAEAARPSARTRVRRRTGDAGGKATAAASYGETRREGALRRQDPAAAEPEEVTEEDVSISEVEPGGKPDGDSSENMVDEDE
ncbi:MAG TPA: 50S ribosomal protein L29 [Candidatus Acidoferrales bacterium]|jgi:large subunit ribosomal protein L29|nr:50S ribosomal protein L29 [Candidatus Acidoferrales bacterium]